MILIVMTVSLILSGALMGVNSLIGTKSDPSREKLSAFECGFDPKSQSRLPFSLHFFLVALIFLIFDVEITILLPIPLISKLSLIYFIDSLLMSFVVILIFGAITEWVEGSLDWSY